MDNFNEYIDFYGMFKGLYFEHEKELIAHRYEASHYDTLINFFNVIDEYELLKDDCEMTTENVSFVFAKELERANESTNYVDVESFYILYDRLLGEFVICELE